ncbi:MAG: hypothetical protein ABFD46_01025 [Armatimonadota bacterium]
MEDEIHVQREEEAGRRGGAASAYAGAYAQPVERGILLKDRVRWASVWGGYLVAFALQLWLTVLGFAIFGQGLGAATTSVTTGLVIWAGVAALIALFVGGLLAARLGGIAGTDNGIYNGVVLWGLSFVILMVLASLGAGGVLGAMLGQTGGGAPTTPGATSTALGTATTGAWWFFIFQFLALVAAAAGGALGARPAPEEEASR